MKFIYLDDHKHIRE